MALCRVPTPPWHSTRWQRGKSTACGKAWLTTTPRPSSLVVVKTKGIQRDGIATYVPHSLHRCFRKGRRPNGAGALPSLTYKLDRHALLHQAHGLQEHAAHLLRRLWVGVDLQHGRKAHKHHGGGTLKGSIQHGVHA